MAIVLEGAEGMVEEDNLIRTDTMEVSVKLFTQPEDSNHCGIACAAMILDFYGLSSDYDSIAKELLMQLDSLGLSAPRLGLYLMENFDLDIDIVTLNPFILSIDQIGATKDSIYARIKTRHDMFTEKHDKDIAASFLEFIEKGGTVVPEIPSIEHMQNEIQNGRPIIASITSNFLFGNLRFNFHYNVVTGFDNDNIFVNDPNSDNTGGVHKHKKSHFLYAIHSAAYGDIDNGCLIRVKPKSTNVQL